ncbi:MAG: nucleotidyltransferase [Bacteroidetes bacterium 46-16]|nr:MAG: nucleotidyltransferase [Bacteroidetes bacterium 46-16]
MERKLTKEQREQFSDILEELGKTLDITEAQFDAAVRSYQAVGAWLSKEDSLLSPYQPLIRPQGSFLLGTMIRPINENDDLDIDLVCQLTGKDSTWTQKELKQIVGNRIKEHEQYKKMLLSPDGRRCWTLMYAEDSNYHLDILPALISQGYYTLEKSFSAVDSSDYDSLAIRITDKLRLDYDTSINPNEWLLCNPFGFGRWFFQRASLDLMKSFSLTEAVKPVPKYQLNKLPLQRAVQILKRHRDMMFNGDQHKPISIIITTLAARIYSKETDVISALVNVVGELDTTIEERYDERLGRYVKWIPNPVNPLENFADKWAEYPEKERNFYMWVKQLRHDIYNILGQIDNGVHYIREAMQTPFGRSEVIKAFSNYAEHTRELRESGKQFITPKTGIVNSAGTLIKNHNFYGAGE